jgi:hypothetical protein
MDTTDVITLKCPACKKLLKIKPEMAGLQLTCPKEGCGAPIVVPGTAVKPGMGLKAQLMLVVGLVFAVIAGVLAIREMQLEAGWIVSLVLVSAVVIAEFLKGYLKTGILALFTLVGLSTPALFFLLERKADHRGLAFYVGTAIFFALSSYIVVRTYNTWSQFDWRNTAKAAINLEGGIVWFALIASSIAFSWVTYYKFFTPLGQEEFLVRRLVFTLFFVVVGVVCSVLGRSYLLPFLGVTGLIYMAAGVVKALAYDITHTDGVLRIGVFAGCGAVLLLGGFLMTKKATRPDIAVASASAFIED